MIRIKPIKPKKGLLEQVLESKQKVTCPACTELVTVRLKDLTGDTLKCPKCNEVIPITHR